MKELIEALEKIEQIAGTVSAYSEDGDTCNDIRLIAYKALTKAKQKEAIISASYSLRKKNRTQKTAQSRH